MREGERKREERRVRGRDRGRGEILSECGGKERDSEEERKREDAGGREGR